MILSQEEKAQVENAIAKAERRTSGEIVAVIAKRSGTYFFVPFLWASLIALALPLPLIFFTLLELETIYLIQLGAFAAILALLQYQPLRLALAPTALKRENAHRRAVEQFLAQNLHTKPGHTGVLLFVSVAERYVEVLAEAAIHAKAPEGEWKQIVDALTVDIGRGRAGEGLSAAVASIGEHLAAHFPAKAGQDNALPNHLIILDAV